VLTSTDLKTWVVHRRWSAAGPPGTPGYDVTKDAAIPVEIRNSRESTWGKYDLNDAIVKTARWGAPHQQGAWIDRDTWAPGVIQLGTTWYAYYAVKVGPDPQDPKGFGRYCISVATSTSPLGPFRDNSTGPVQCQSIAADPAGSIDPYPYRDPNGRVYLLWKASGKIGSHESSLLSAELGADGRLKAGAPVVKLLETSRTYGWEGSTIENPAMINYRGTTYLFYSANFFGALDATGRSNYATGYAICPAGPTKPCTRPTPKTPLLASNATEQGPGGAAAFTDTAGQLRLAYHSYWPNENRSGFHPRRLHIATIVQNADRTLRRG
jgi:GH43 family beta-xylosidase